MCVCIYIYIYNKSFDRYNYHKTVYIVIFPFYFFAMNYDYKDQILCLNPKGGGTSAQRAQNNEFVENEL